MDEGDWHYVYVSDNGSVLEWTPSAGTNYQCVNGSTPDEGDWLWNKNVVKTDLYDMQIFSLPPGATIARVEPYARMKSTNPGASIQMSLAYRLTGTLYQGPTYSYDYYVWNLNTWQTIRIPWHIYYNTNPITGLPWKVSDVNNGEWGIYGRGTSSAYQINVCWYYIAILEGPKLLLNTGIAY